MEESDGSISVQAERLARLEAQYELVKTMRASFLALGPLLARFGRARVSTPGGCAIGSRPVDLHLEGLQKMGARVRIVHGYVEAEAEKLQGARIYLDVPSVGATEHLMTVATLAEGTTVIENAAREPEVVDLARALTAMGARIGGAGEDMITIEGVAALKGCDFTIIPDRIEAGTFMMAAAITGGDVYVRGARPEHLHAVILKLREAGVEVQEDAEGVRVIGNGRLSSVDIKTMPYPGFPTDLQAQMMAVMALADGRSVISETIFENRFMHVLELNRMGADIKVQGHSAFVRGVATLERRAGDGHRPARQRLSGVGGAGGRRRDRGLPRLSPRPRLQPDRGEALGAGRRHPPREGTARLTCASACFPPATLISRASSPPFASAEPMPPQRSSRRCAASSTPSAAAATGR